MGTAADVPRLGVARLTIVLGVLSCASPLAVDMYLPAFASIGRDLGADMGEVQLTFSAFAVAVALAPLIYGPLSDRFGRRTLVLAGMAGFVVSSVLCSIADSFALLLVLRAVQGATSAIGVLSQAIVRDVMRGHEALRLISLMMLIHSVSPLLAPAIGSAVIEVASWRWIFVLLAVPGLISIALILIGLPETLPRGRRRVEGARETAAIYWQILRSPDFLIPTLLGSAALAVLHVYVTASPFLYIELFGISSGEYSLIFAAGAVIMIGSAQAAAPLAKRVSASGVAAIGTVLMAGTGAIVGALPYTGLLGPVTMIAAIWAMLIGVGLLLPTSAALSLEHFEADAGAAASMANAVRTLCGAGATVISGLAFDGTATPTLVVMAGCALLGLVALRWLPPSTDHADQVVGELAQESAAIG